MAASNFTLAVKGTAARVHRASCKRSPEDAMSVEDVLAGAILGGVQKLAEATIASCCKPKAAQVYIFEAIGATARAENIARQESTVDPEHPLAEDRELDEPDTGAYLRPEEEEPRRSVRATGATEGLAALDAPELPEQGYPGVSKHYWDALARTHATLEEALAAFAALKVWRRSFAAYKALPPQDTKWVTSERYAWERDFLVGYMAGLAGSDPQKTYADSLKPARQGLLAAQADLLS